MKGKDFQSELIDYLYGEMSDQERHDFEMKMEQNPDLKKEYEELFYKDTSTLPKEQQQQIDNRVRELVSLLNEKDKSVPNAPFKKTWPEMIMRDVIADAVNKGKDGIAWSTGKIQVDRWGGKEASKRDAIYDKHVPQFFEREFGVKPEKVETRLSKEISINDLQNRSRELREQSNSPEATANPILREEYLLEMDRIRRQITELRSVSPDFKSRVEGKNQVWYVPLTDKMRKIYSESAQIATSIFETLTRPLRNEGGFIEIDNLSPEKYEALRKLGEDARKAGESVFEFVKKIRGPEIAKVADEMFRQLNAKIDVSKPSVGTEDFQTGGLVNSGKMERKSGGYVVRRPEVHAGELADLKSISDPELGMFGRISEKYRTTPHAMDKIKSPLLKQMDRTYHEIEKIKVDRVKEFDEGFKEAKQGLTRQSSQRIGLNLNWRQEDSRYRMERDGFTEADIPTLTEAESKFITYMDEHFKERGQTINQVRTNSGHSPIKLIEKDYFKIAYAEGLAEKLGLKPNMASDRIDIVTSRQKSLKETYINFKKVRSKEGLKKAMNYDALGIFESYMKSSIDHELFTPFVSKLHEFLEPLKTGEFKENIKGEQVEKTFSLQSEKPNTANFIRGWANNIAGRDPNAFLALADTAGNRLTEKVMNKLQHNLAVSLMAFSVRTAEIQYGALINTSGIIGVDGVAKGTAMATKALVSGDYVNAVKRSRVLKSREPNVETADFLSGAGSGIKKTAISYGFLPIKAVDFAAALSTFMGAESFALKKIALAEKTGKFSELENLGIEYNKELSKAEMATRFADDTVLRTQGSSLKGDIAPIQRSALGRLTHAFQTFAISDWNFLYNDVFGIDKNISTKLKVKRMMNIVAATTLSSMFFRDVLGVNPPSPEPFQAAIQAKEDGKDLGEVIAAVGMEFVEKVPLVGGMLKYGSGTGGAVMDAAKDFITAWSDSNKKGSLLPKGMDKGSARKMALAAEAAAKLGGIPGVGQAAKSTRAYQRGETPLGVIQGSFDESRRKGGTVRKF